MTYIKCSNLWVHDMNPGNEIIDNILIHIVMRMTWRIMRK